MSSNNRPRIAWSRRLILVGALLVAPWGRAEPAVPACFGPDHFATQSALVVLVNRGFVADAAALYRADGTPCDLRVTLLDSEPIGLVSVPGMPPAKVHRQVQKIHVSTCAGEAFELLTIAEVSDVECSLAPVTVLLRMPASAVLQAGQSVPGLVRD